MDFTLQDIVAYLLAGAGAIPHDETGIWLAWVDGEGDLIEKFWTGTENAEQYSVFSNVRENASALYLFSDSERYAFTVDTAHKLRFLRFDPDDDEWSVIDLKPSALTLAVSSQLSGVLVDDETAVLCLECPGGPQSLFVSISRDGECETLAPAPVALRKGTPHKALLTPDNRVHLLYIHEDNCIHHMSKRFDADTDDFDDTAVPGSYFEDCAVINFLVIPHEDMAFEIFALISGGTLVFIDRAGQRLELGSVANGKLSAASSEECVLESISLAKKGIRYASGWVKK